MVGGPNTLGNALWCKHVVEEAVHFMAARKQGVRKRKGQGPSIPLKIHP